jgi:hypothetical protein
MPIKSLKPASRTAVAAPETTPDVPHPDAANPGASPGANPAASLAASHLRRVAEVASRSLPPAIQVRERRTVMINLKVGSGLADALAERAEREGATQKQIICRALAAIGLPVDPLDLQDRTKRRMRGTG